MPTKSTITTLYDTWKNTYSSNFAVGVRMLEDNNPQAVTRSIMERFRRLVAQGGKGVGGYDIAKLADALRKTTAEGPIAAQAATPAAPAPAPKPAAPANQEMPPLPPPPVPAIPAREATDAAGKPLTSDRAKELHKEHAHYHALMVDAKTDEERVGYAREIVERINPALDAEYDRLRALAHVEAAMDTPLSADGTEVPVLGGIIGSDDDMKNFKKLQSVRASISRIRKELKGEMPKKKRDKLEAQLAAKEREKAILESRISS